MNWDFFQNGITLLGVYIFLDTCLLLAVSTVQVLIDRIRARINGQSWLEERAHSATTDQASGTVHSWAIRRLAFLALPFPLFCIHPIIQLS